MPHHMLTLVLILNLLIAGLCWYGVWRICQWRQLLSEVTQALVLIEQSSQISLREAPLVIQQGQAGITQLRQHYQQMVLRFQQMQRVVALFGLGQVTWQRYRRRQAENHR